MKKSENTKRLSLYLPKWKYKNLKKLYAETDDSMNTHMNLALDDYFAKKKNLLKK